MSPSTSGGMRYARFEAHNSNSWFVFLSKLAFSVKFITLICLLVTFASFFFLIWARSKGDGHQLEKLAHLRLDDVDSNRPLVTRRPKILRTLGPDVQLAIGRCPHPQHASQNLLNSVRLLDSNPLCKKALFADACQLEKGLLYASSLPVTCPAESNAPERLSGSPRILFVIDVNSGGARQVERLLIHIYKSTHYYLLLIPNCFSAVTDGLRRLRDTVPNIRLLYYDIYCPDDGVADVSLPQTPESWQFIIQNSTGWPWNYLLSLDSYDFPLLNIEKLTSFLEKHSGMNFLESYSLNEQSEYITNITSLSCSDGRRWPIGQGKPPSGLDYFQGPPWYLMTRQFLDYALFSNDDKLVSGLRKFASLTPFPAQLLFHSLAHNGRFCHTFYNESLRVTKFHIFDQRSRDGGSVRMKTQEQEQLAAWTFTPKDFVYLSHIQATNSHNSHNNVVKGEKFFARRFDPTISQQIMADIESTLYGKPMFPLDTPRMHSYWQTLWTNQMVDRRKTTLRYAAIARLLADLCLKRLKRCPNLENANHVQLSPSANGQKGVLVTDLSLFRDYDMNDGLVLSMNISCGADTDSNHGIPVQCYVNFQHHEKIKATVTEVTDLRNELLHMRVGSDYDPMDATFRNYAGSVVLNTEEQFGLRTQWVPGEMGAQYQFAWLDPNDYVAGTTFSNVGPWTSTHFQSKSEDLRLAQTGIWTAALLNEAKVVGATDFLVLPESQQVYELVDIKERLRWGKMFFEVNRLCTPISFSKTFARKCRCGPPAISSCETTGWSPMAPDTKSNFPLFLKQSQNLDEMKRLA